MSTFTVSNSNATGAGSLDEAIVSVDAGTGGDTIQLSTQVTLATTPTAISENVTISGQSIRMNGGGLSTTAPLVTISNVVSVLGVGGTFDVASGAVLTLTSTFTESAPLTKTGAGALLLHNASGAGALAINGGTVSFYDVNPETFSGVISGAGGLIIEGNSGNYTLLTGANTYTGGTTVDHGGVVRVANNDALGSTSGAVTLDGGTLSVTSAYTDSHAFVLGAGGGTIDNTQALTISGGISGAGGLTKKHGATLVLTGANTYSGGTTISTGTVQVSSSSNLGASSGGVTLNGGTLAVTATFTDSHAFTLGSGTDTISVASGQTLTLSGAVSGSGALTKAAGGTLVLTSPSLWTGDLAISAGVVEFCPTADVSFDGVISGVGALAKDGSAVLTLTGANTFTGGATISGGTVEVSSSANLGASSGQVTLDGGTLSTTATFTDSHAITLGAASGTLSVADATTLTLGGAFSGTGDLTKAGTGTLDLTSPTMPTGDLAIAAGTVTFAPTADTTYAGVISGAGALAKDGSAILTLTGANTFTGGTTIDGGAIVVSDSANLGASAGVVTLDGGTLATSATFTDSHPFTLAAGGGTLSVADATTLTLGGAISGSGALVKTGAGILTLTGFSTFSGSTTVSAGVLEVDGSLDGSAVGLGSHATLTGGGHVGAVSVAADATLTPGDAAGTILSTHDLTMQSGSMFALTLASDAQNHVDVTGAVSLGGATLSLDPQSGLSAVAGETFTVISNDGSDAVTGTFAGLAEGATVTAGGLSFQVSYVGGSGNDVTLTVEAPPAPSTPALESASDSGASNSDQITNNFRPTLSGTAEAHATVILYDTNGTTVLGATTADGSGNWSVTVSTLADGDHAITAKATDAAGNLSAASGGLNVTVDATAPTVAITSDASSLHAGETATITFTFSEDPGSSFSWDGSAGSIVVSGGVLSAISGTGTTRTAVFMPTAGVDAGTASITVAAGAYADAAGNHGGAGGSPSLSFDTLAPDAPSALQLASDTGASNTDHVTNDATPTLTGTAAAHAAVTLYDTDGTTLIAATTADGSGNWSATVSTLADGDHTVTAKAADAAGNVSAASAGLTATIDTHEPAEPSAAHLASGTDGHTEVVSPTFTGAAEAHATVTLYDTDGTTALGSAVADGNGDWSITSSTLSLGEHTVAATATDLAGNVSAAGTGLTVTIEAPPPPPTTGVVTVFHPGGDSIAGDAQDNLITSSSGGADTVNAGDGADTVIGGRGGDVLQGAAGQDSIAAGAGADVVRGGQGDDQLQGNAGHDLLFGDKGVDTIHGGQGDDLVQGNAGNDLLFGDNGADTLHGGQGDDQLFGGAGDDYLSGDLGANTLAGGDGADVFDVRGGGGHDLITDFSHAQGDHIWLSTSQAANFDALLGHMTMSGGNTVITLPGQTIVVAGVSMTTLTATDFVFT